MKKYLYFILGLVIGTPLVAWAVNITVPAAPSGGAMLISTSTGAYVSTTTDPAHFGSVFATSTATSTFSGSILVDQVGGQFLLPTSPLGMVGTSSSALQSSIWNLASSATSSADFVVMNDKGNNNAYYADFGCNSSNGSDVTFTINSSNDCYLYANDGAFSFGVATTVASHNYVNFFTGGTLAANERMRINSGGQVGIGTTTPFWALTIASSTGPQLALVDTTNSSFAWTFRSISNTLYIGTSTPTATSTFNAFVISPNGFVGIATSTPLGSLSVGGKSFNTTNGVCFQVKATGTATSYVYYYFTSAATQVVSATSCSGNGTTTVTYD